MSNIKIAFGTSTGMTCTLASLANGSARESTAIDNTSNLYADALVTLQVKLQNSSPSGDKCVYVYAYGSEDGTNYTDNATGSDAAITLASPPNVVPVATIATPTGNTTYRKVFSVAAAFGGPGNLPRKWGIVVKNASGVTLSATEGDHAKTYSGVYSTVV